MGSFELGHSFVDPRVNRDCMSGTWIARAAVENLEEDRKIEGVWRWNFSAG